MGDIVDLLVIGGGINGAAIARDAAGRGLGVVLCDKGDLAGATSSASTKLIHGGLRYLEHGQFRLVREALAERAVLLRMAPHLVRPLRLIMPHGPGARPRWMLQAGLFLYDRLGGDGILPGAERLQLRRDPRGGPLCDWVRHGFALSDCRTDDSRLTVATARDAAMRGAVILPRTEFLSANRDSSLWRARLRAAGGDEREVRARILVNAAGPWVGEVLRRAGLQSRARMRLVKGSHIVVPSLYQGDHGYLLQNDDGRIVFVLPFEHEFSLIGTTELAFTGDPAAAHIDGGEIAYLCTAVARWFGAAPGVSDIRWQFCGVRALYDDRARNDSAVNRDYVLELDENGPAGAPTAISIFGGKLTTHRRLAERVLERLAGVLPGIAPPWTAGSLLPGGIGLGVVGTGALASDLARRLPFLDAATAARLAESYGSEAAAIFAAGPGRDFGHGLFEAELSWLAQREWAESAEDVLWRRTKLGLHFSSEEAGPIAEFLAEARHPSPPPLAGERGVGAAGAE